MRTELSTRTTHATETVRLPDGGDADVVVVADTHGRPHPGTASLIEKLAPAAILHAGDIGDLSVLADLRKLALVLAVRGNIDGHAPSLPDSMRIDFVAGDQPVLRVWLTHIAVYGPKLRAEVARQARACSAGLVICGHSHVPFIGRDKGLVVFNPGSIGPRRFHLPIVFGVLRVGPGGISMRHVSCETGETWLP
ncbi:MAG TPA: metallophosphoesterase family protein [Polyangia bacterium]